MVMGNCSKSGLLFLKIQLLDIYLCTPDGHYPNCIFKRNHSGISVKNRFQANMKECRNTGKEVILEK
jgi:hypothetical protein